MSAACLRMPKPPFLHDLLGNKQSTYIKFKYDDDSTDISEDEKVNAVAGSSFQGFDRERSDESRTLQATKERLGSLNFSQLHALNTCLESVGRETLSKGGISLVQGKKRVVIVSVSYSHFYNNIDMK